MNEVKQPKKPLIYYYIIVLLVLMLFNFLAMPWILQRQVREVDYGTFISMTEEKQVGQVEIQAESNQIIFTDKDNTAVYKTGMVDDPDLTARLYNSGAKFSGQIIEQMSPILSFLLTWVLPIVIFIGIGQWMSKKMMDRAGGPNSSCLLRGDTDTDRSAGSRDSEETARESTPDSEREPAETGRAGRLSV